MKDIVLDSIKLESPSNYLLNELAKYIKYDNKSESLMNIISRFTQLRYDNRNQLLKVSGPML